MNWTHLLINCKNKQMMKSRASPTWESCTVCFPIEFHGFTSRINSKGYHSLVPGLISSFSETAWVPVSKLVLAQTIETSYTFHYRLKLHIHFTIFLHLSVTIFINCVYG